MKNIFKGGISLENNPNYPQGKTGDYYIVTVHGIIGGNKGVALCIGDQIHCINDIQAGNQKESGMKWIIIQEMQKQQAKTGIIHSTTTSAAITAC